MSDWFRAQPKAMPSLPDLTIPAGGMPALPPIPQRKPTGWAKAQAPSEASERMQGVSAAVVMHHFARSEIRSLDAGADALYARLIARLKARHEFRKFSDKQLREVIKNITFRMQSAELTINFKAEDYFKTENTWTNYSQMYELAQRKVTQADGTAKLQMRLTDRPMNAAATRDAADTRVTFGAHVNQPDRQGIARFMQTGGLKPVGTNAAGKTEYEAYNTHFNPKARQQFTALNYGRRPHGGIQGYGMSHFVLRDSLKDQAIYYVGDTFQVQDTNSRVTHGMLFAAAVYGSDNLVDDILNSCYRQMILGDTSNTDMLIEGHIFEQIAFAKDILEMRLSENDINSGPAREFIMGNLDAAGKEAAKQTLRDNARKFAARNGIKLVWMD
jgi:hypothetical protein